MGVVECSVVADLERMDREVYLVSRWRRVVAEYYNAVVGLEKMYRAVLVRCLLNREVEVPVGKA